MSSMHARPIAALAWKEWREQRPIVLAGLVLSAALPLILLAGMEASGRSWTFGSLVHALPAVNVLVVWPLLAVVAGSTTISNEMAEGTLGFILSRPVARRTIWLMKVIFGCLTVLAVALGSSLVFLSCQFLVTGALRGRPIESLIELISGMNLPIELLLACIFFVFATGVFFSSFISRALTAAAGGLLLSLIVLPVLFVLWTRIDTGWEFEAGLLGFQICLASLLTLTSSLYLFTRSEGRSGTVRSLAIGMVMILGGLVLVSVPIVYAHTRVIPSTAYVNSAYILKGGDRVITEVTAERSLTEQIWSIPVGSSKVWPLTARHARIMRIAPDGRWITYLSRRGVLGLRSDKHALRVSRTDGGEDRLMTADIGAEDDYSWIDAEVSPDGEHVAYTIDAKLYVAPVVTGLPEAYPMTEDACDSASVIGWTSGGEKVILMGRPTCLSLFDPASGLFERIFEVEEKSWIFWQSPRRGYRHLPLFTKEDSFKALTLSTFDVENGERKIITESACLGGDVSPDGLTVGYALCEKAGDWYRSEFRIHDIMTGSDRSLGTVAGRSWDLHLSPDGGAIAARVQELSGEEQDPWTLISISPDKTIRFDNWIPVGWSDPERMILRDGRGEVVFAIADVNKGLIEKTFP